MRMHLHNRIQEMLAPVDARPAPVPDTEEAPCEIHNPDFFPEPGPRGQIRPPVGLCRHCAAKPRPEHRADPPPLIHHPHYESPYPSERALAAIDNWKERQAERDPRNVPGTLEHEQAIALIDERREEDLAKERRKTGRGGGQLVCQRIEGGEFVQYVDVRASIHDRPAIVRVAP